MSNSFVGTERFKLVRQLGQGGFGIVYEAFDRKRSARVALKLLRDAEGTALYRFKREFRALADISHPNLVTLDELVTAGDHWFFTMELVRGVPAVAYARAGLVHGGNGGQAARLDEARVRSVLSQLADALSTIHRAGIVHCDLKPSNVLVTREGRAVVLDFGLVAERPCVVDADGSLLSSLALAGTPSYMAPEQATGHATPAADMYGVGVMLYEILTGRLPFSGSGLDVIEAKQHGAPCLPTELNRRAPSDLSSLAMALLNLDPLRRPTADAVLQLVGRPSTHRGATTHPRVVPDVFLARERHLEQLNEAFEASMRGETAVAFLSGGSGMGKTALVRRFLDDLQTREPDLLALTSRCYERESMPYKAIDPLVDALARHLRHLRDIEVARLLPRDVSILARVFPVLLGAEEVKRAPRRSLATLDSLTVRRRAAAALRDLLFELALTTPLVLVIDDAHWGDVDSGAILSELLRPPEAPPLLVVMAYRSEDASDAGWLRSLIASIRETSSPKVFDIDVGPLAFDDARTLAARLTAGTREPADLSDVIARESGGNAFLVHELAHHATTVGGRTSLAEVVHDRVDALPDGARRLMRAVALSAQPIPASVAAAAAGIDTRVGDLLQVLRASRLVRGRADERTVEAYHDRIREAIVSQLSPAETVAWHGRLAQAWERSTVPRPETLVAHFEAAGDTAKTIAYAAIAARKAEEALAFERAAEFYGMLVRLAADRGREREWLIKLGLALGNAGRGRDAAGAYLRALDGASPDQIVDLERRAATELIRAGYLDDATAVLERLLPKIGVRPPGSDRAAFITLLRYRLLLTIRGTHYRERAESDIPSAHLRRIDVLSSIGAPLCLSSFMQGTTLNVQAMWHALRSGEPARVLMALTALAVQTAIGGSRTERRAHDLVRQAGELAERLREPWATGRVAMAEGMVLKLNGHWKRGVERLRDANRILAVCTGVRWETETAQILMHDALYFMGEWGLLARELPARRQETEQRGDLYSAAFVAARMGPLVQLAADRSDLAQWEVQRSLSQWTKRIVSLQHRFVVCTALDIALYENRPDDAAQTLAEAWPKLRGMLFAIQHHRIEMTFYRARVALALAATGEAAALRRAERDARRLTGERARWAQAFAALVRAAAAAIRSRPTVAADELTTAETAFRDCDMNLFAAAAQYRRGSLVGGDEGHILSESALAWMRDHGIVNPARLTGLLTPGFGPPER